MINKRIDTLIQDICDGNKRLFSRKINVAATVIENIVGKRQGKPSFEVIEKIVFAIENINADWLITGRGSMLLDVKMEQNISRSSDDSLLYKMYKEEKAENKALVEEIGALKLTIRQQEEKILGLQIQIAKFDSDNEVAQDADIADVV